MKKCNFLSCVYKSKFENGTYQINLADEKFVKELREILEEGFEPFQILQVGNDLIFFLKKEHV